jgi:hypothetical protein
MESLTLPTTAAQAKVFISPSSLSFPMSHADQTSDLALPTPHPNAAGTNGAATSSTALANGTTSNGTSAHEQQQKEMVTTGGVSGIVPTLQ